MVKLVFARGWTLEYEKCGSILTGWFYLQLNLWRYGDFTEDDAKEFGFN